jgi:hypothetical protein
MRTLFRQLASKKLIGLFDLDQKGIEGLRMKGRARKAPFLRPKKGEEKGDKISP